MRIWSFPEVTYKGEFDTSLPGEDNPEQGGRDNRGGDAQDPGQPRVERLAADGIAGAAHLLRRLILVEAVQGTPSHMISSKIHTTFFTML